MRQVPTYALYGETEREIPSDWLHCESIPARSALFDWEIGLHRHRRFFQILNITAGQAECRIGEELVVLEPPAVVTVPPGLPHGFRFSPNIGGHVITMLDQQLGQVLRHSPEAQAVFVRPHAISLDGNPELAQQVAASVAAIAGEFPGSAPGRLGLIEAHMTILLVGVGRLLAETSAGEEAPGRRTERHAAAFRVLLDREFRRQRSVTYYASQLGVSEVHLNRICRSACGTSALGMINRRVMLEASRDLIFTVMTVKEIAYSLGFDDPAYFTRFFTKHAGMTPTAFRRRSAD